MSSRSGSGSVGRSPAGAIGGGAAASVIEHPSSIGALAAPSCRLQRGSGLSVAVHGRGRVQGNDPALGRARGDEPEQRAIERVDPGRDDPDGPEPEAEDRVLAVARVVVRHAVRRQHGEVRLAAEPVVQGAEQVADRLFGPPRVL